MDRTSTLLEIVIKEMSVRERCGTCGKVGGLGGLFLGEFNTCMVCGATWCDGCASACKHSSEE